MTTTTISNCVILFLGRSDAKESAEQESHKANVENRRKHRAAR